MAAAALVVGIQAHPQENARTRYAAVLRVISATVAVVATVLAAAVDTVDAVVVAVVAAAQQCVGSCGTVPRLQTAVIRPDVLQAVVVAVAAEAFVVAPVAIGVAVLRRHKLAQKRPLCTVLARSVALRCAALW